MNTSSKELLKNEARVNTVLFVDDEPNIISALQRGLTGETYQKYFAVSGREALQIMAEHDIHVLVTDMRMPIMNGLTLLKTVAEEYPSTIRIVLSGYAQLPQVLATINQVNVFRFIPKPWNLEEEFIPMIRSAIDFYNMTQEYQDFKTALEKQNLAFQKTIKESEATLRQLKLDWASLDRFKQDVWTYSLSQLSEGHHHDLKVSEFSSVMAEINTFLREISTAYPQVPSPFSPDQLRSNLNAMVKKIPAIADETGERRFLIMHDNSHLKLLGRMKLYVIMQHAIINLLIRHKPLEDFKLSQIYDAQTETLLLQYEFPNTILTAGTWELPIIIYALSEAHKLLPGKFFIQKDSGHLVANSICHCEAQP